MACTRLSIPQQSNRLQVVEVSVFELSCVPGPAAPGRVHRVVMLDRLVLLHTYMNVSDRNKYMIFQSHLEYTRETESDSDGHISAQYVPSQMNRARRARMAWTY